MMPTVVSVVVLCLLVAVLLATQCPGEPGLTNSDANAVRLSPADTTGSVPLEQTIATRRSVRSFTGEALSNEQIGQLLWAAQGITDAQRGFRAAPSAGALYPLEVYVVTAAGVYHYEPHGHVLRLRTGGDHKAALAQACLGQPCVQQAGANFVFTAVYSRTQAKYGQRARSYVDIEVGAAGENLLLQAVALDLGAVMVGAFRDEAVVQALQLPADHYPVLVIPVGHPA